MAESIGEIGLDLVVNEKPFNKQMKGIQEHAKKTGDALASAFPVKTFDKQIWENQNLVKKFDKQMQGIQNLAKKTGAVLAAAFSVKKIVDFGKSCIELGSDLSEVQNVVDVTFPNMSAQVDKFAKSAAGSFGLSETMAKQFTGTFGAMAKAFGFTEEQAYDMSTSLTGLAGDVASFYNITQDEAYTKLKSVFTGETESLKDLGVVMTQSALDAYAMANGYGKTTQAMSEAEKVALRYAFVQQQLTAASGDFARTSDGWANQVRILKLNFDSLKASIGQGLINVFTPVLKVINSLLAKLMTLASAFKSFTEMVTGKKADQGGGGIADTAADLTDAAGAADSLADSTSGVGKAAKKAAKEMRSLMGFDQINKLIEPAEGDESGGGGGTGGGISGGNVDFGSLAEGETVVDKLDGKMQALIERGKELAALFKKGFIIGFGDSEDRIASIRKHIGQIGKSLKEIFTDKGVAESANRLFDSIALNAGKVAGAMTSIGITIADNLIGGIDGYLQSSKDYIKKRLISIFEAMTEIVIYIGEFSEAFQDVFSVFSGDNAKRITASIIGIFADAFLGALDFGIKFRGDILALIVGPFIENKDLIKETIDNTLAPVAVIFETLHQAVKRTFDKINKVYDEHISPMFKSIRDGLSEIVKELLDAHNEYIVPVLEELAEKFKVVWNEHIQPMIEKAIEFIGQVADCIKTLWEDCLQPLVAWIIENIVPVVASVIEDVGNCILDLMAAVSDVFGGIFDILGGFLDFLVGIFAKDNEKAWKGLGKIIDGFKDAAKSTFDFMKKHVFERFGIFLASDFAGNWTKNFGALGNIMDAFSQNVSNAWESIKRTFSGAIDFVAGAFTGNWSQAWEGVKNIFGGIWDSLVSCVKSPINAIIGFMNALISGAASMVNSIANMFNSMSLDIPEWVPKYGGGKLGFHLPTWTPGHIPYLAQGGYVKPNTPQLAVIGDNRRYGEIVAPEDKLQAAVDAAVKGAAGNSGITRVEMESIVNNAVLRVIAALESIGFYVDGQELAKALRMAQEKLDARMNPVKVY